MMGRGGAGDRDPEIRDVVGADPDTAGAWVAQSGLVFDNLTDFLRPMASGRLDIVAAPIIQGQTEQLWEVTMSRSGRKTVARSRVRLRNVALPRERPGPA